MTRPGGHQPCTLTHLPRLPLDKLPPTPECSRCRAQTWPRSSSSAPGGAALAPVLLWAALSASLQPAQLTRDRDGLCWRGSSRPPGATMGTHQGTSALSALSSPARGAGPLSGPGAFLCFPFPLSWASTGLLLLMSTLLMPSRTFTTRTPKADVSLTSAPCCWQHGAPALLDLAWMD